MTWCLLSAPAAFAQVAAYTFSQQIPPAAAFTPITGTVLATAVPGATSNPANLDDVNFRLPEGTIPFAFRYNGNDYTSLVINSNGYVTFGAVTPRQSDVSPISSTTPYDGAIAVMSPNGSNTGLRGLTSGNLGKISYAVEGSAPNRSFVVQWANFTRVTAVGEESLTFQLRLQETTNAVAMVYGPVVASTALGTFPQAQVGLRGYTNADFHNRASIYSWATTANGTLNNNAMTLSPTVYPASGTTFIFTPPAVQAVDAGIRALVSPASTGCYSNAENVTVRIKNYGLTTLTSVPVQVTVSGAGSGSLSGTFVGNIAPNSTADFTLPGTVDMSASGSYVINATTTLSDGNAGNNSLPAQALIVTPATALPAAQVTFTGFDGNNLSSLFPGWREAAGSGTPFGTTSTWVRNTVNQQTVLGSTAARFTFFSSGNVGWIMSPRFTAAANTVVNFRAAITEFNNGNEELDGMDNDDAMRVMVSADCGTTWSTVYTFNKSNQPTYYLSDYIVNLSNYAGQNIMVAFVADEGLSTGMTATAIAGARVAASSGNSDYDFHLDNIRIDNQAATDMGISRLVQPSVNSCFTSATPAVVELRNFGSNTVNFSTNPATVVVNMSGPISQSITTVVNSGALLGLNGVRSVSVGALDMSIPGTYTLSASVTTVGDSKTINNEMEPITRTATAPVALPLADVTFTDFNGTNLSTIHAGWREGSGLTAPGGTTSNWGPSTAAQTTALGSTTARVNLSEDMRKAWIVGPRFVATNATGISFDVAVTQADGTAAATMGSDDKVQLMVSTDCGTSFTALSTFTAASALSNVLTTQSASLRPYAGQEVIIAFLATDGPVDDLANVDFHLDNIRVQGDMFPGLAGNYTINKTQPTNMAARNFASFADATAALTSMGITGAVTFNVVTGTGPYNEQVTLPVVNGSSAVRTITFNGNGNMLVAAPSSATARHAIKLDGTDYVTFDNLKVTSTTGNYGWGFFLTNGADFNVIRNSTISVSTSSNNATAFAGVVASASTSNPSVSGNTASNLTLSNNTIIGGYYSISLNGNSASKAAGMTITNNVLTEGRYYGMYLTNMNAPVISNNRITMRQTNGSISSYGMYLSNLDNAFTIAANKIMQPGAVGLYLSQGNATNAARPSMINNMIGGGFQASNGTMGVQLIAVNKLNMFFNSISVDNGNNSRALVVDAASNDLDIRNNSFSSTGGSGVHPVAMELANSSAVDMIDYNNYYTTGNNLAEIDGDNARTLANLRTATGMDQNSVSGNPAYAGVLNLHATGTFLNAKGVAIAGVATDIDGDARTSTPDIGADEYTPGTARTMQATASAELTSEVYPNPFADKLTLQLTNAAAGRVQVLVTDLTGKTMLERSFNVENGSQQLSLDVNSSLPSGMYLLRIVAGEQVNQHKLIKQ